MACFALPVVGYMSYSAVILHYGFEMSNMGDAYLYGRTAHAADCATLKIPADEQPLCPSAPEAATLGVDGLVNTKSSPRVLYQPVNVQLGLLINTVPLQRQFAYSVLAQQPMRVVTFGYQSPPTEAAKARDLMVEALKNAKHVSVHRR